MIKKDYNKLQKQIGYAFKDERILAQALSHASTQSAKNFNNEKMEFLGDRVLGLAIAEHLFRQKDLVVGEMAQRLAHLVSRLVCAEVVHRLSLFSYAHLARGIADEPRSQVAVAANLCEALITAIYLDGGFESARRFIEKFWAPVLSNDVWASPKNLLQEAAQAQGGDVPGYRVVSSSGPDHAPLFIVEVSSAPFGHARGEGSSRQIAEKAAARALLARISEE